MENMALVFFIVLATIAPLSTVQDLEPDYGSGRVFPSPFVLVGNGVDIIQIINNTREGIRDNLARKIERYHQRGVPDPRLQVDGFGQVLSTQQYKKLLASATTPLLGHLSGNEIIPAEKPATFIFPKLLVIRDHFLLTWTKEIVIIADPVTGNLVLWNNQFDDIEDVCCWRQEVYIFHTGGHLTRYSLLPPKECAAKLFVMGQWLQCSKVLTSCKSQIISVNARDYIPAYVVHRLKDILKDDVQHEELVEELDDLETRLEGVTTSTSMVDDDSQDAKSLLVDNSDTYSVTSDLVSNTDSELNVAVDSGLEDTGETPKTEKKEKLARLKNMFQGQLKDISLDSVLMAGAQAAGNLHWTSPLSLSTNMTATSPRSSWVPKSPVYNPSPPSYVETPGNERLLDPPVSSSREGSCGSWGDADSDTEVKKEEMLFKDKKKKKKKVHTVEKAYEGKQDPDVLNLEPRLLFSDLVSPLQPTDLIKMEKTRTASTEDLDKFAGPAQVPSSKLVDLGEGDDDGKIGTSDSSNVISNADGTLKSLSAKQEVVQKARKFLKRLTPEESGHDHSSSRGTGAKSASTCISAPLEVKSLVIMSRETRKKIRDSRILYDPKALRPALLEWIVYLEKANAAVDRVYPKNKDTREYYVTDVGKVLTPSIKGDLTRFLDADDTASISSLATMCFKMNIYTSQEQSESGNDNDVGMVTSDGVLKCDACEREPNRCFLESVLHCTQDKDIPNSVETRRDGEKSRFLGVNFPHLDYQSLKASIIANCHDRRNLLKILLSSLDDFTERDAVDDAIDTGDTKVALQLMRDKPEHYQKRLLRHVFRLYYLVPRDVARLCAEIYPYFHPWEVVLVCLSSSANLFNNCSDFLIYFTHLLQKDVKKRKNSWDIFDEIYHSKDFLILVFHSALILDDLTDSDVRCQCGWPRRHSHQTSFQYEELMIEIADHFRNSCDNASLEALLKISWNHGYWQGCVQILVMLKLRREALQLVLQLGDITLMSSKQMWGTLPQTPSEWRYALEFLINLDSERSGVNKNEQNRTENIESDYHTVDEDNVESLAHESEKSKPCIEGQPNQEKQNMIFENISLSGETNELDEEYHILNKPDVNSKDSTINHVYQHTCINGTTGGRSIDIKSFSLLFLQKVGPSQALQIISDSHLQSFTFTHDFYYRCILSSLLENHQSALCHRLLRELNQHMWTSKCTAVSPQIYQMKEVEITRGIKEDVFKDKQSLHYTRTLEDGACHWGINLPLPKSVCGACPLPLCENLPGHNQGIVIFPCGHVFHKECNPENYCLTCFHNKLKENLTGFAPLSTSFS